MTKKQCTAHCFYKMCSHTIHTCNSKASKNQIGLKILDLSYFTPYFCTIFSNFTQIIGLYTILLTNKQRIIGCILHIYTLANLKRNYSISRVICSSKMVKTSYIFTENFKMFNLFSPHRAKNQNFVFYLKLQYDSLEVPPKCLRRDLIQKHKEM